MLVFSLGLLSGANVWEAGAGQCAMECQHMGLLDGTVTQVLVG